MIHNKIVYCLIVALGFGVGFFGHAGAADNPSDAKYKASCLEFKVADLTNNASLFKGKNVKYTGQILVMDFRKETDKGKTSYGIIVSVKDETMVLPGGLLPVYVTFAGQTDAFIYDTVTFYGEVKGDFTYKSATIKEKVLPWVEAKFLEKDGAKK